MKPRSTRQSLLSTLLALVLLAAPAAVWAQEDQPPPTTPPPPPTSSGDTEEPPPPPKLAPSTPKRTVTATNTKVAAAATSPDSPVVRAVDGNWGLFFLFGGLATLSSDNVSRNVAGLILTRVGMRYVLKENFIIPMYLGFGSNVATHDDDDNNTDDSRTNVGFELGGGIEYHFRIWRRISPFVGAGLGFRMEEPTGDENWLFGLGLGPNLGVEYYIADRVSLIAQYYFTFQFLFQRAYQGIDSQGNTTYTTDFAFQLNTLAGGSLSLVFYF